MMRWIALAAALLVLVSCSNIRIERPEGFAEYRARGSYRAVSPEGMQFGVRTVDNYPRMDLDFWTAALKSQLMNEGYRLVRDVEPFEAGSGEGVLFEWGVPYGNESYIYLTAILVSGDKIAVAEAGGEHTVYKKHREALLASIGSLSVR